MVCNDPDCCKLEPEFVHGVIRAKWTIDGAKTLKGAATMSRGFADMLDELADEGYELVGPVEDDYGFYKLTDD